MQCNGVAGRVRSRQVAFGGIRFSNLTRLVRSSQDFFEISHTGSSCVRKIFLFSSGRVGLGVRELFSGRVGSGHRDSTRPDLIPPDPTRAYVDRLVKIFFCSTGGAQRQQLL